MKLIICVASYILAVNMFCEAGLVPKEQLALQDQDFFDAKVSKNDLEELNLIQLLLEGIDGGEDTAEQPVTTEAPQKVSEDNQVMKRSPEGSYFSVMETLEKQALMRYLNRRLIDGFQNFYAKYK